MDRDIRHKRSADVVGNVPKGHDLSPFSRTPPVNHRFSTRRPTHSVEPAVRELESDNKNNRTVDAREQAKDRRHCRRKKEPERHEPARIAPVRNRPHHKLGNAIRREQPGHRPPQLCFCVFRMGLQDRRHRERQIVANQIESRVPDKDSGKNLPAEPAVLSIDPFGRQWRRHRRGLQEIDHCFMEADTTLNDKVCPPHRVTLGSGETQNFLEISMVNCRPRTLNVPDLYPNCSSASAGSVSKTLLMPPRTVTPLSHSLPVRSNR